MLDFTNFSSSSGEEIKYDENVFSYDLNAEEELPVDVPSEDMLSSIQEISEELEELSEQLNNIPNDLYEAEKIALFGKDYKFVAIDDLEIPRDFNASQVIEIANEHYDDYEKIAINLIEQPEAFEVDDNFEGASILWELSGNKVIEPTENRKAYFEHLELIKSIQLSAINEENAHAIISKIAYSTANMLSRRNLSTLH